MAELVPELHDVLKLTTLHHDVSQWSEQDVETFKGFLPINSETWKGITQHHLGYGIYPTEPDTFYLCVADSLASGVTRIRKVGPVEKWLNKLWKGPGEKKDVRLEETNDIISLFRSLQGDPTWEGFLEKHESRLKNRPESFYPGENITSLYTHCKLTGQFYRILKNPSLFPLSPADIQGKTKDKVKTLYRSKYYERWQLVVARCKFNFLQRPYRVRDLNIFGALRDLMEEISTSYPDNVVLGTSNELLIIFSDEAQLSNIAAMSHQKGFWVEVIQARGRLSGLKPILSKEKGEVRNLYDLPSEISPPICEICQSAKATKYWPEDYILSRVELCPSCRQLLSRDPLASVADLLCEADRAKLEDVLKEPAREELCQRCFALRAEGTKLQKLDRWSNQEQNKVAWVKLNLDFDQLEKALKSLSGREISFSVVAEFQEDYSHFLQRFNSQIRYGFGVGNVENIMNDFFCINVGSFKESFKVLKVYHELLQQFFPAFLNLENSPLKIAMLCSNVKFPFFEVWRILEEAQGDIFVSLQGMRTMRAPIKALVLLVRAADKRYRKSALHKLTKIEETSKILAELTFQNRKDEEGRTYSILDRSLRPELDFSSIFTFARLIED